MTPYAKQLNQSGSFVALDKHRFFRNCTTSFLKPGNRFLLMLVVLVTALVQQSNAQCGTANNTQYPAGSINAGTGTLVTISAFSYEGDYSVVTGIVSGAKYKFTISVGTDVITVRIGSRTGTILGSGSGSATVTATSTSDLYVHWNTSSCGTASVYRTTTVQGVPVITSLSATSGCAGGSFSINGTNLSNPSSVTIGGTAVASISSSAATQITVVTGSGTTGTVAVTNGAGSGTSASTYTFNAAPTVYTVTGGGAFCSGGTGIAVGLSSSQLGTNYQLYNGAIPVGSSVGGLLGLPISFGNQTAAGTYTVVGTKTSGGCSLTMTGSATITVNPLPQGTISGNTICAGGTGQLTFTSTSGTGTFTVVYNDGIFNRTASGVVSGTPFNPVTNPSASANYTLVSVTDNNGCVRSSGFTDATATITVNPLPVDKTPTAPSNICSGTSTNVQIASSQSGVNYQLRNNTGNANIGSAVAGTGGTINLPTGTISSNITYNVLATNPTTTCSVQMNTTVSITADAAPTAFAVTGGGAYCTGGTGVVIGVASSESGVKYQLYNGASTVGGTVNGSGSGAAITFGTQTAAGTYTVVATKTSSSCSTTMTGSVTVTINPLPQGTFSGNTICPSGIGQLTFTASSGTGPFTIVYNDGTANRTASTVTSGTPFNAFTNPSSTTTYTVVSFTDNNGCIRNSGFTNGSTSITVNVNPADITPTAVTSAVCAGTGTNIQIASSQSGVNYQLRNNTGNANIGSAVAGTGGTINLPTGNLASSITFNVLATNSSTGCNIQMSTTVSVTVTPAPIVTPGGVLNTCQDPSPGAITLSGASVGGSASTGAWSITSGSGTLSSTAQTASPASVTFTPAANYSGTVVLTLTTNAPSPCAAVSSTRTINVNALPTVTISPNYCIGGGMVRLTCSAQSSYVWSTGATTQYIDVNIAGSYTVTGTNAAGCSANASISVAQELVTNGNFSAGNTGFITLYTYTATNLIPESYYTVGTNPNNYHPNFFGNDHTTGSGNFMIVNGSPNTQDIWQQSVTVLPNTNYYFSAWATSLNNAAPYAQLRFAVNDIQIGTTAVLAAGPSSSAGSSNWVQFYGTWNSGSSTVAKINIIDLQTAAGGNDFGVDDISFSTLAPVTMSVTASANTPVCAGTAINLTSTITGGSSPYTYSWTGPSSYTASTQNPVIASAAAGNSGVYSITVTDGYGCSASASTASVSVVSGTATLTSGSGSNIQTVCNNSPITTITYAVGGAATGATITGLPTGVTGVYSSGTVTISGTPSVKGTFNYTVTTTGSTCTVTKTGTITVNAPTIAGLTSVCVAAITQLTGSGTPAASNPWVSTTTSIATINTTGLVTGVSAGTSTITYKDNTGCTVTATAIVQALPTISGTLTICGIGNTSTLSGSGTAAASNPWTSSSTSVATVNATGVVTSVAAGTTVITYTNNNGCSITATVTVSTPAITGTLNLCGTGSTTTLTGSGTPAASNPWVSATTSVATINSSGVVTAVSTGTSVITYTNNNNCTTTATVTVNVLPTDKTPTAAPATVCAGFGTNIQIAGSQSGVNYQLRNNTGNVLTGSAVAGTGGTINLPTGNLSSTTTFNVLATNATTSCSVQMINTVTVTVNPSPTDKTPIAVASSVCSGNATNIQITTSQSGVNYQLRNNTGNVNIGSAVAGTGGTINLPTGNLSSTTIFNVLATNAVTSCFVQMVNTVTVTVNALPTDKTPTAVATTVCNGTGTNIQIATSQSGVNYQLRNNTGNVNIGSAVAGTGGTINLPTGNLSSATTFNVLATDATTSCFVQMVNTVTVTINPLPTDKTPTAVASTLCSGNGTNIQIATSQSGVNYQLRNNTGNVNIGSTVAGTGGTINLPTGNLASTTTFNVLATDATTSCFVQMVNTVTVTINPLPTDKTPTALATVVCNGTGTNIQITTSQSGVNYQLRNNTGNILVGSAVAGTGGTINLPTGNMSSTTTFNVLATNAVTSCFVQMVNTVTVTVNALPTDKTPTAVATTVCNGTGTNIQIATSQSGVNYQLRNNTGNVNIGSAVAGTGGTINLPTGNLSSATTFNVLATDATTSCFVQMVNTVTVTINPLPTDKTPTAVASTLCAGNGTNIQIATSQSGVNYQLRNNTGNVNIGSTVAGTGGTINLPTGNLASTTTFNVLAADATTSCSVQMVNTVTVTVNPLPTDKIPTAVAAAVCNGTGTNIQITTSQSGVNYQLRNNTGNVLVGSVVAGTGGTINLPTGNLSSTTTFNVLATNSTTSCFVQMVNTVTVTVNALPTDKTPTAVAAAVCNGTGTNIQIATSQSGINYQLRNNTGNVLVGSAVAGTGGTINLPTGNLSSTTTFNVLATDATTSCSVQMMNTVTVTVNPLPTDKTPTAVATTVCSGNSTNIQIATSQTGINYQLRNNTGNVLVGSAVAGTGGTINLPTGTLTSTTTFNVLSTDATSSCSVQMVNTVTVTVNPSGQWIGGSSGDWNTGSNWCGGVPTSSTNVNIPASTTVNIQSANAVANSVTIAGTGSLVMTGAYNLNITAGGTFNNSGTFTATSSTGTVAFLGSGTISGTTTFKNIDTYGALDFGTASTIAGTFSLQTGGSVTGHSPTYTCPSAVLLYKPGSTFSRGLEWTTASSGAGYPANVLVQNNTTINFPAVGNGYICYDLQIDAGSSLQQDYSGGSASLSVGRNVTITGTLKLGGASGGDLSLGGNWTRNTGGVFTHNDRKVTFDGTGNFSGNGLTSSTISAPASSAKDNEGGFGGENFAQLIINKTATADSVVLLSNITVNREFNLTKGTFSLRNSDVTMVSNSTRTADIAPITTIANVAIRYAGTGRFVIQRFIQNPTNVRSWRLLAAPVQSATAPTINAAYQEGVVNPNRATPNGSGGIYNPWPGYGTHITGPGGTYSAANGWDQGTNTASILYANAGVTTWTAPSSTTSVKVTDQQGWMLFVRGDRSFAIGNQYVASQNATLEPKGKINIGNVVVPIVTGKQVIANPYPSAISLLNVDVAGTLGKSSTYYMWDPKFFTSYTQPGKWVTFTGNGTSFAQTTSQSAYLSNGTIESGQAFVINATSAGNITFHETDKLALTSSLTGVSNRPMSPPVTPLFRSDIYVNNQGNYLLTDAVLNIFSTDYTNAVNEEDAPKVITFNTKESLSILRDSAKLAIEKRMNIQVYDTIFFAMSKFNELPYRFRFDANNFTPGMEAWLEDNFNHTRTALSTSDTSIVDFNITSDSLSKATDRFRVVFKAPFGNVLPVTFTNVKAYQQNKDIAVEWAVANELNTKEYEVHKSTDGINFTKTTTQLSQGNYTGNRTYNWLDEHPVTGDNYYRIVSRSQDERLQNSPVVKVNTSKIKGSISVYPNPITDGIIKLGFENMEKGNYAVRLLNATGQVVMALNVNHAGGNVIKEITAGKTFAKGMYNLEVNKPDKEKMVVKVIIE